MRQRHLNWNAMQRDMKRYRSPEQMLIREMLDALKAADAALSLHGVTTTTAPRTQIHDAIRKAENR